MFMFPHNLIRLLFVNYVHLVFMETLFSSQVEWEGFNSWTFTESHGKGVWHRKASNCWEIQSRVWSFKDRACQTAASDRIEDQRDEQSETIGQEYTGPKDRAGEILLGCSRSSEEGNWGQPVCSAFYLL